MMCIMVLQLLLQPMTGMTLGHIHTSGSEPSSASKSSRSYRTATVTIQENSKPLENKPRAYQQVHVIAVGIKNYASRGIPTVDYADRDAQAFGEVLKSKYGYTIHALSGKEATRVRILEKVQNISKNAKENDAIIFFYSGHGKVVDLESYGRTGFILPYDAELELNNSSDISEWRKQAIEMSELTRTLNNSTARHAIIVLDCCASGFLTKRGEANLVIRADQQELLTRKSRSVLAASTEDQFAYPDHDEKQGIFTASILKILKEEKVTSLLELFTESRKIVITKSKRNSLPQKGDFSYDDGEFVFVPLAINESDVNEALADVKRRVLLRNSRITQLSQVIEVFESDDYIGAVERITLEKQWQMKYTRFEDNSFIGDPLAMAAQCIALRKGIGCKADPKAAFQWARKAYETNHPIGKAMLAYVLNTGTGVEKNTVAAEKILTQTSEITDPFMALLLAEIYSEYKTNHDEKIMQLLTVAEKGGLALATIRIAEKKIPGAGFDSDKLDKIILSLKELLDKDNSAAAMTIFRCISAKQSPVSEADQKLGLKCLILAAEKGNSKAQSALAREYFQQHWLKGQLDLKEDPKQAFRWAELAMESKKLENEEIADAMQIVAISLITGKGTKQDVGRGIKLANQTEAMKTKNSVNMTVWLLSEGVDYIKPD